MGTLTRNVYQVFCYRTVVPLTRPPMKHLANCFLKRPLRTRLDLLKPDVNSAVCLEQAKQKNYHDIRCWGTEYAVGQQVQITIVAVGHVGWLG